MSGKIEELSVRLQKETMKEEMDSYSAEMGAKVGVLGSGESEAEELIRARVSLEGARLEGFSKLEALQAQIDSLSSQVKTLETGTLIGEAPSSPQLPPSFSLNRLSNAAAVTILSGLALQGIDVELGWEGWVTIAGVSVLVAFNPGYVARVGTAFFSCCNTWRRRKRLRQLEQQIHCLQEKIAAFRTTKSAVDEWMTRNKNYLLAVFQLNRSLGKRAAQEPTE